MKTSTQDSRPCQGPTLTFVLHRLANRILAHEFAKAPKYCSSNSHDTQRNIFIKIKFDHAKWSGARRVPRARIRNFLQIAFGLADFEISRLLNR